MHISKSIILVTGPCRSGKSVWAEKLMLKQSKVLYFAASLINHDKDWLERVEKHKQRRPADWFLIENVDDVISALDTVNTEYSILIDSLGGFVSRYIHIDDHGWNSIQRKFLFFIKNFKSTIVIVIEETGWSVVPSTRIGNLFRERMGLLSQSLQTISNQTWLVINGRAINITEISLSVHDDESI